MMMDLVQIARCGILLVGKLFPFEFCKNNLKFNSGTKDSIDQILDTKRQFLYYCLQDSIFLSQGNPKSFLFKMYINGFACDVNIMKCMQLKKDLEGVWLMFDHYKCVPMDNHGLPCL
jgi:hypothetical protein